MELVKWERMSHEEIAKVYAEGLSAVIRLVEGLYDRMEQMRQEMLSLSERMKALEDRLVKDSHNSHKPPSSDGFRVGIKSVRVESGKGVGGQKGHEGRTLSFAERVDEVVIHEVERECRRCGRKLEAVKVRGYERRQVWDIPEIKMRGVEHRTEVKRCPGCGESVGGEFPEGVKSPVQYGEKIKSLGVYLNQYQLLPYERTSELLEDVFGCSMSVATIETLIGECYQNLERRRNKKFEKGS